MRHYAASVAALEDKLLQRAVTGVLNAVCEADFRGFSYGFRPGRSPHHALDALAAGILRKKVNFVLDADIRGFYDAIDHGWMLRFLEHRIADRRVLRLIRKWLKAGVIENGEWSETLEGAAQGASVSPLLSNVYLHYVFDLWADRWRRRHAHGDVVIVRFADDYVVGFEHRGDAERFLADLRGRLAKFSLELAPEKTRLIEFGRFASERRKARGLGKPGDVPVPRLHAHLREDQERALSAQAHHRREAAASKAAQGQGRVSAAYAPAHPRAGPVARRGGSGTPQLLRRARQHQGGQRLPVPGGPALVSGASAPQPAHPPGLGSDDPPCAPMAPASPDHASLA